jgi:hypothetical protein
MMRHGRNLRPSGRRGSQWIDENTWAAVIAVPFTPRRPVSSLTSP